MPLPKPIILGFLALLAGLGCTTGEGVKPRLDQIYFPVGLSLDPTGDHLLVANSDFDLQFNAGTLQSLDTSRILAFMPAPCASPDACANRCGALSPASAADQILVPGPCAPLELSAPQDGAASPLTDSLKIGAFATDLLHLTRPSTEPAGAAGRAILPLRGSASLLFVDVDASGRFQCEADSEGECAARYSIKTGVDALGATITLPREPVGIAATLDGRTLVGIHQVTEGPHLSVLENDWSSGLTLRSVRGMALTAFGGAFRPSAIALVPGIPDLQAAPSFLVTARTSAEVRLVTFLDAERAAPEPPQVREVARASVNANAFGADSRGIVTSTAERDRATQACTTLPAESAAQCLADAARIRTAVYVANRSPASLLIGEIQRSEGDSGGLDVPVFKKTVPLSFGPSRVVLGNIANEKGELEPRVFVLCFDSRLVFVYDPVRGRIETEIRTGRGPHALVVDERRRVAYVAHFTDSYLGVIDLDRAHTHDYGKVVLSVGRPTPPRASK